MKLTVLDGYALNPGDLTWDSFKQFASVTVYERTPLNSVINHIDDSDAVLLNKIIITPDILKQCPNLKYIGILATGYNVVDVKAARKFGVTVTNVPSYSTMSVAQHVFSFITAFTNHVQLHSDSVMKGRWTSCPDFCYWEAPLTELAGKTLGIFGYGHIGERVALIGQAFGMNIICCPHRLKEGIPSPVSPDELFQKSDFLTLHAPLTPETTEVVNRRTLSLMKESAYVINTARGGLVNEKDVRTALDHGRIAGYACDVLTTEPMKDDCPLLGAPNCLITPHIAWAPKETRIRLMDTAFKNFECYLKGSPQNVVS
ncbi:MAG: D-2-hydroxyacid dehydrogenase [Treponema sp.]|nr:D-2-hydroxyacid dehydrogenase [Treponema sp.]